MAEIYEFTYVCSIVVARAVIKPTLVLYYTMYGLYGGWYGRMEW